MTETIAHRPVMTVLRVVLEAASPLSIASGDSSLYQDVVLVRDANGLPVIPGTSLAGVLRALVARTDTALADTLFGCSGPKPEDELASEIAVSNGCLHGRDGRPVDGMVDPAALAQDPVLAFLSGVAPGLRDHVALSHRGVVDGRAKFDRAFVPAGARFSAELAMRSEPGGDVDPVSTLEWLAELMGSPSFRLGGATRRGYGRMRVVEAQVASWNLATEPGRTAQSAYSDSGLAEHPAACSFRPAIDPDAAPRDHGLVAICLKLQTRDGSFLRTGAGPAIDIDRGGAGSSDADRDPDASPLAEPWIEHLDGDARVHVPGADAAQIRFVLPGSGIKGALAHRTAFECRKAMTDWTGETLPAGWTELFGAVTDNADGRETGRAGAVFVDDAVITLSRDQLKDHLVRLDHVSIDRFTQGARDGLLFNETALFDVAVDVTIGIDEDRAASVPGELRQAFARAVDALAGGALAIGANDGDGMGRLQPRDTPIPSQQTHRWFADGTTGPAREAS